MVYESVKFFRYFPDLFVSIHIYGQVPLIFENDWCIIPIIQVCTIFYMLFGHIMRIM